MKYQIDPVLQTMHEQHIVQVSQGLLERKDIIPMWFGEGDKITPKYVREAAIKALEEGDGFYTEKRGRLSLRRAINDYQKRVFNSEVGEDRISVLSSGMSAIQLLFQMILSGQEADNDNIIIIAPIWPNAASVATYRRAEIRYCLLEFGDNGLSLDFNLLESMIDNNTRAIFVNSPNNPSGWMLTHNEIQDLLGLSRRHGLWLIADEVYNRLTYDDEVAPSFLPYAGGDDLVIIVNSFSKAWAMTGWRVGWLVHPHFVSEELNKLIEFNYSCVPGFVQQGCLAAIELGDEFISELVSYCDAARGVCLKHIGDLSGVEEFCYPNAGFYLYFRVGFRGACDDILGFARSLADDGGVGLAPGSSFGPHQEGWLRLCYARNTSDVEEAFHRMGKFFAKY